MQKIKTFINTVYGDFSFIKQLGGIFVLFIGLLAVTGGTLGYEINGELKAMEGLRLGSLGWLFVAVGFDNAIFNGKLIPFVLGSALYKPAKMLIKMVKGETVRYKYEDK